MRKSPGWGAYGLLFLIVVTGLAFTLLSSVRAQQRAREELCSLVVPQDDADQQVPPTTPTGRQVAEALKAVRVKCD